MINEHINRTSWGKPLPVIASFDAMGNVAPLYVQIEGERYQIKKYYDDPNALGPHNTFICTIEDYGIAKNIKLVFNGATRQWRYEAM